MLTAQVAICQHICLFGYMKPSLFLLALFLLPMELPLSLQYLIGFLSGFVVDAFAHTFGYSSFALASGEKLSLKTGQMLHPCGSQQDQKFLFRKMVNDIRDLFHFLNSRNLVL